ncbi:MAG: hypothetical protein EOO38_08475 [Cytophagaceae bacterium]|nr:MAG: hypothetical protein EOO38_08475 [Cytophagaceae bacterium]
MPVLGLQPEGLGRGAYSFCVSAYCDSLARSSVSKILTEQLNNLASDLIQGVDINFGVNSSEDYSTGSLEQKTDLEVGLSKKLLNDRLTVTVGSSFGLEGPPTQNQNSTNIDNASLDGFFSGTGVQVSSIAF